MFMKKAPPVLSLFYISNMYCDLLSPVARLFLNFSFVEGSSEGIDSKELCVGSSAMLPHRCAPSLYNGPLYFTPTNGRQKKLLMDNMEVGSDE